MALEDVTGKNNIVIGCIWQGVARKRGVQSKLAILQADRKEKGECKDLESSRTGKLILSHETWDLKDFNWHELRFFSCSD